MSGPKLHIRAKALAFFESLSSESDVTQYQQGILNGAVSVDKVSQSENGTHVKVSYPVDQVDFVDSNSKNYYGLFKDSRIHLWPIDLGVSCCIWLLGRHILIPCELNKSIQHSFIQEFLLDIFASLHESVTAQSDYSRLDYTVTIKVYEVVADQVRDLIDISRGPESKNTLRIREHTTRGAYVQGLVGVSCTSAALAWDVILHAYQERSTLVTNIIQESLSPYPQNTSSQHAIVGYVGNVFILIDIEQALLSLPGGEQTVLHRQGTVQMTVLADPEALACQPRGATSPTNGVSMSVVPLRVACNSSLGGTWGGGGGSDLASPISMSQLPTGAKALTTLSRVIATIDRLRTSTCTDSFSPGEAGNLSGVDPSSCRPGHIPYRDSTLTRLLQPALEGSYANIVCLYAHTERDSASYIGFCLRMMAQLRHGVNCNVPSYNKTCAIALPDSWMRRVLSRGGGGGLSGGVRAEGLGEGGEGGGSGGLLGCDDAHERECLQTHKDGHPMVSDPMCVHRGSPSKAGEDTRPLELCPPLLASGDDSRGAEGGDLHTHTDPPAQDSLSLTSNRFWDLFSILQQDALGGCGSHITSLQELEAQRALLLRELYLSADIGRTGLSVGGGDSVKMEEGGRGHRGNILPTHRHDASDYVNQTHNYFTLGVVKL